MAVGVNIVSTFDSKGISRAIKDFQKIEGAGNKATFGLRTLDKGLTSTLATVGKVAVGVAAAGAAIGFSLVSSAVKAQAEQARLRQILLTTAGATDKQVDSLIAQADALEKVGVASAGNIITAQSQLATFDLQFATIQKLTPAITDYVIAEKGATATAEDFKSMTNGLAQALNGQFGALTKSGFVLDENTKALISNGTEAERAAAIVDVLSSTYGGFNEAAAQTTEGRLIALKNSFEALRTEIGMKLIPIFEKMVAFIQTQIIPFVQKFVDIVGEKGLGEGINFLATSFLNVTTNMGTFGNVLLGLTAAFIAFRGVAIAAAISQNLFNTALLANPIGRIVAILITLGVAVVAAYLKFEGFRKVVNSVINFIIGLIENWLNAWIRIINAIITGINLLIKAANFFGAGLQEIGKIGEVEFGRISSAAQGARKEIGSVAEVAGAMAAKEGGVQKVVKALNDVAGAAGGVGGAGGAAKAVETAGEKLQKYIDKLKGLTQAQRSYRDSQKGVLKADTDLLEAKTKLADAQAYMNDVLKGFGAGSRQAKDRQKELDKAQRGVERSNYSVEGAVFAVSNAEAELAKLRADPESSAQAIREAEISLAEAKLSVADATDSQTDATNELATAQLLLQEAISGASESSDTYLEAAKALMEAQVAERDATDQQTAAYERQKDALDALTKAQEEATAAKTGVKPAAAAAAEAAVNAPVMVGGAPVAPVAPVSTGSPLMDSVLDRFTGRARELMLERGGFTAFAEGGIVTSPMMGLVGEAGSEAIIPLDRLGDFGGQTINITINAGMGTDATKLGDEIVDVLTRYQRRNGALPLKVA